jgi:hypothetical protein
MGNWSHVICYNATGSDGYFHVKELYEHKRSLCQSSACYIPHYTLTFGYELLLVMSD